jgi:gliding motility-associated-like protein
MRAQDPVALHCTEVDAAGNVTATWQPPSSSTGFEKYIIYFSPNGGTYSKIDSIENPAVNSYTHIGADAGQASRHYFIEARYESGFAYSDTLQTIYLQLNNLNFNLAQLFWNAVSDPLPDGSSTTYEIYKEFPLGNWQLTNTSTALEYEEPGIVCNDSVSFRLEIVHSNGCRSVSNVDGAWFKILDEPAKPVIDSISVNVDEHVVIGWEAVSNAQAYIIYRFEGGIWLPVDTVVGKDNTFYEDVNFDPCLNNTAWSVATIDTCGSSGPKDENPERKNIRITSLNYDPCSESIIINWNNYRGPLASQFEIWVSEGGNESIKLGTTGQNDTTFVHELNTVGSDYEYYVRARFSSGTSTTCKKSIQTFFYNKPEFVYLSNASVLPTNYVELKAILDTTSVTGSWEIRRSEPSGSSFSLIHTFNSSEADSLPFIWVDSTANASEGFYLYYLTALDSCGKTALESNELKTIWLTVSGINEDQNLLEWNAFEDWDAGVELYYIYRMVNGVEPAFPFDSVGANTLQYTDDLSSVSNLNGPVIYWIQASENDGNAFEQKEKANSNRTGVALESEMYVASAFRPTGLTTEFKPVFRFYNGRNYTFQIYNRWGKLIFESNDPYTGWDGRFEQNFVQQGTYIYRLVYQNIDDSFTEKKGTVTVVY